MMLAHTLELFRNLVQYEYNGKYYDLHNEYECDKIIFLNGVLLFRLRCISDSSFLLLKFTDVKIVQFDFFNIQNAKGLTLDNLYRGRAESKEHLIEISEDNMGYFYLEFYEGQKIEFWAKGVDMEKG
ncbi:MAG TPA: hypothetical protein VL092_10725 [Chitinophagaceae bacterium]|nr:hypothetical protein [Chitinophagaceae bacterium]